MRKSVAHRRRRAYVAQRKRCFYCELPMWLADRELPRFAALHGISEDAAQALRCTAEHVNPRQDGGAEEQRNIVAACMHCNRERHANGATATPLRHRQRVMDAMADGVWHRSEIHRAFAATAATVTKDSSPL
jgi:HNH endonuclease